MAGGWLKFEASTPEKPEVFAITVAMGWDDPDLTVGKLLKVWRWFDQQTIDGNAPNVTLALLDRISGVTGFAATMCDVGWLAVTEDGVMLPNFDRHNGKTAKDRALTAKRVEKHKSSAGSNGKGNGARVTSPLPREEKNREEKIIEESSPFSPDGGASEEAGKNLPPVAEPEVKPESPAVSRQQQQAEQIYSAYPKKAGRQEALKHIKLVLKAAAFDHLLERTQAYAAAVATWPPHERQYIPDPERWFKKGKYDDDPQTWQRSAGGPHWQSGHGPATEVDYSKGF